MFDAILYFYQSKGVFKAPSNIAEEVVTDELAFFEISLDKIFEAVAEDSKIIYVPTTIKQKVRIIAESRTNMIFQFQTFPCSSL